MCRQAGYGTRASTSESHRKFTTMDAGALFGLGTFNFPLYQQFVSKPSGGKPPGDRRSVSPLFSTHSRNSGTPDRLVLCDVRSDKQGSRMMTRRLGEASVLLIVVPFPGGNVTSNVSFGTLNCNIGVATATSVKDHELPAEFPLEANDEGPRACGSLIFAETRFWHSRRSRGGHDCLPGQETVFMTMKRRGFLICRCQIQIERSDVLRIEEMFYK